jgi:hypothetical protein
MMFFDLFADRVIIPKARRFAMRKKHPSLRRTPPKAEIIPLDARNPWE